MPWTTEDGHRLTGREMFLLMENCVAISDAVHSDNEKYHILKERGGEHSMTEVWELCVNAAYALTYDVEVDTQVLSDCYIDIVLDIGTSLLSDGECGMGYDDVKTIVQSSVTSVATQRVVGVT